MVISSVLLAECDCLKESKVENKNGSLLREKPFVFFCMGFDITVLLVYSPASWARHMEFNFP